MAYFDSSKNTAIWTKRLNALRKEKAERAKNGFRPTERKEVLEDSASLGPGRRPISFEELVAKCEAKAAKAAGREAAEASMGHSREAAKAAHESRRARQHQRESVEKAM